MSIAVEIKAQRIVACDQLSGIEALAISATIILALAYIMAAMACLHWVFDLFSHFMLQYMIVALALAFVLGLHGQWIAACAAFVIFALSLYQINPRPLAMQVTTLPGLQQIEVLQYNQFQNKKTAENFVTALQRQNTVPDIMVLQEITPAGFQTLARLDALYPHKFPATAQEKSGTYILSRHPITHARLINTATQNQAGSMGMQADIKIADNLPSLSLYALHARRPLGAADHARRNHELRSMAAMVAENETPYKIFAGDWNITPYSPFFRDILRVSKLNHTYYGLSPAGTWPSFIWPTFLRLPIDHILHSEGLKLNMLTTGPSLSSDHKPVSAIFTMRETAAKIVE